MAIAAISLQGCRQSDSPPEVDADGGVTLVYWQSYNTEEKEVFLEMVRGWEEDYAAAHPDRPVRIQAESVPWDNVDQMLATAAQSNDTPDIVRIDYNKILPVAYGQVAVPLEEIENFGELFPGESIDSLRDRYVGAAYDACLLWRRGERHLYALPEQITCLALMWNRALFRQRRDEIAAKARETGLDLSHDRPPRTWEELEALGHALTFEDEDGQHYGFGMRDSLWFTIPFLSVHGVEVITQDESGRLDCNLSGDPRALFAMERLQRFTQGEPYESEEDDRREGFEGGAWSAGADPTDGGFEKGTYAMVLEGVWHLKRFNDAGLDYGVALVPALSPATAAELGIPDEENHTRTNLGGAGLFITRTARDRGVADEALEFLEWWTGPDAQAIWGRRLGQIPVNLTAQVAISAEVDDKTATFIQQSVTATTHPRVPRYGLLETANWNPNYALMLQGNLAPQEALARIQSAFYRVSLDLVNESID